MIFILLWWGMSICAQHNQLSKAEVEQGITSLHKAAKKDDLIMVDSLITMKADVHARDNSGKTALHFAAEGNSLEVCEHLLKNDVEVNIKDTQQCTALYYALLHGNREVARKLLEGGGLATLLPVSAALEKVLCFQIMQEISDEQLQKIAAKRKCPCVMRKCQCVIL